MSTIKTPEGRARFLSEKATVFTAQYALLAEGRYDLERIYFSLKGGKVPVEELIEFVAEAMTRARQRELTLMEIEKQFRSVSVKDTDPSGQP